MYLVPRFFNLPIVGVPHGALARFLLSKTISERRYNRNGDCGGKQMLAVGNIEAAIGHLTDLEQLKKEEQIIEWIMATEKDRRLSNTGAGSITEHLNVSTDSTDTLAPGSVRSPTQASSPSASESNSATSVVPAQPSVAPSSAAPSSSHASAGSASASAYAYTSVSAGAGAGVHSDRAAAAAAATNGKEAYKDNPDPALSLNSDVDAGDQLSLFTLIEGLADNVPEVRTDSHGDPVQPRWTPRW